MPVSSPFLTSWGHPRYPADGTSTYRQRLQTPHCHSPPLGCPTAAGALILRSLIAASKVLSHRLQTGRHGHDADALCAVSTASPGSPGIQHLPVKETQRGSGLPGTQVIAWVLRQSLEDKRSSAPMHEPMGLKLQDSLH